MPVEGKLTLGSGSFNRYNPLDPEPARKSICYIFFATQAAEVEVDTETGKVDVLQILPPMM